MAQLNNTFIVKERLESMEKKLEQVLNEEGLHELAKDITKKALASSLSASKSELNEIVKTAQITAEASLGKEKQELVSILDGKLEDHAVSIQERLARAEKLAVVAMVVTALLATWNVVSCIL